MGMWLAVAILILTLLVTIPFGCVITRHVIRKDLTEFGKKYLPLFVIFVLFFVMYSILVVICGLYIEYFQEPESTNCPIADDVQIIRYLAILPFLRALPAFLFVFGFIVACFAAVCSRGPKGGFFLRPALM